jgi:RND family efflux transporter MFP subunit
MLKKLLIAAAVTLAAYTLAPGTAPAASPETFKALASERTVSFTGYTRARTTMELVSENAGRVQEVMADVGDRIGAKGVFARLDSTFTWLDLENNRVEQKKLVETIEYYGTEADRYRSLVGSQSAAQSKLDELEHQLAVARHELEALKITERVLKEKLSRFRVKAPAGWTVTRRSIETGEWVAAGQAVGQAGDFTTLIVPFALAPDEYERLESEAGNLSLTLPDKGLTVPAKIHRTDPGFDPETRKTRVELAFAKTDELKDKRGGIRAVLELEVPEDSGAVLVPASAVKELYEENTLTRPDGGRVGVVVLGPGPNGHKDWLRVTSPEIEPGDEFLKDPGAR